MRDRALDPDNIILFHNMTILGLQGILNIPFHSMLINAPDTTFKRDSKING